MEALKANELRIGNWISNGAMPITAGFDQIRYAEIFQPITLTEDWLIRFGFEKIQYSYQPSFKQGVVEIWPINGKLLDDNDREVQYVHQLQNLYFALTGTELTIKN